MKLKMLLVLLLINMIGLGAAVEENNEQNYSIEAYDDIELSDRKVSTPEELIENFGNSTPVLPEDWFENCKEEREEHRIAIEKHRAENRAKKPLSYVKVAEINANAPEGMFLISGIEDVSVKSNSPENAIYDCLTFLGLIRNEDNNTNMVMELNQTVVIPAACIANFSTIDFFVDD